MQIPSKQGGHWQIEANGYWWEAIHSSYVPDWDPETGSGLKFHQKASGRTLEELYVEIESVDEDALECARIAAEGR